MRLHLEQPQLGFGQLARLAERVLGFAPARETVRRILIRRAELVAELARLRRQHRRRTRGSDAHAPRWWGTGLLLGCLWFFVAAAQVDRFTRWLAHDHGQDGHRGLT